MTTTDFDGPVRYQFEYEDPIRCAFIGAGGHSYRNVYPSFQYAPVDLRAICDLDGDRAAKYARIFGAAHAYTDHREMLERERPTAVFIVTAYDPDGRLQAVDLALDCLAAGAHVWMEKPTATSSAEVELLQDAARRAGRVVVTGMKTVFSPAMTRVKEIVSGAEFGGPSSISVRYPLSMPAFERRTDLVEMNWFLDCIFHPAAVLLHLMGPLDRISHEWEERTGASVTVMRFESGAIGTMHLTAGESPSSPSSRVEVIGDNANVLVENGNSVTYYRPTPPRAYGRTGSYLVPTESAPLHWEPEYTYGQLYNKNLFYLGYVDEIRYFCDCVLNGTSPELGSLDQAFHILQLFEAYRRSEPGTWTTVKV
ncbi:Gfo/Idh/MocA family oxidoreductase [Kitasatospora sp. NPDC092948]|uniref:Gfo/Idh/MocA family oxidoreductase n=1 Tax=Kitasatospora sp. NPDC092948 TaxID=3364088 RepID=UPI003811CE29